MNAGHDAGVKLSAVTASETAEHDGCRGGEDGQAGQHRLHRAEAGDDKAPVGAAGGAHDERAAQRGQEGDGDRDHRRAVDVLHRREDVAAAGQPDAAAASARCARWRA